MGGNLFKEYTKRINKQQYNYLEYQVIRELHTLGLKVDTIPYYHSKETFGDMDLLVSKPIPPNIENKLKEHFKIEDGLYYKNGDIISFALFCIWKEDACNFQIDLIFTPETELEIARFYYSYNDLNNLAGKIAKRFNCKFGFTGLFYVYNGFNNHYKKEILLTKDPKKIYEFLDLDYSKFKQGFEDLLDIYRFIESSKYFDPLTYLLENVSHRHRVRDRKRNTYQKFIQYLKEKELESYTIINIEEDFKLQYINEHFPEADIKGELKKIHLEEEAHRLYKSKFNRDIVRYIHPELDGKELGEFMSTFRRKYSKEELIQMEPEVILQIIKNERQEKL